MNDAGLTAQSRSRRADAAGRLQAVLERLEEAGAEILSPGRRRELAAAAGKFRDRRFYLVFLGQFKRGKTTLLNSLLGQELLPTGVLPVTSMVTIVRYGREAQMRVRFLDGAAQEYPPARLPEFVTEKGNPHNSKHVAEVEVTVPSPWLRDGLCLVDTPGIGSLFEHNTQVAYQFVPRADAAIFVFSPEAPLSLPELDFLRHIRGHVEKIFFVMNKADQVTPAEREEILHFTREAIRAQMPAGELRLFAVSARQALSGAEPAGAAPLPSSRLPALLDALQGYLAAHSQDVLVRSTTAAVRRLLRDEHLGLELEARAQAVTAAELAEKISHIERRWQELEVRRREIEHILRAEIRSLEGELQSRLSRFTEEEEPALVRRLEACVEGNRALPNRRLVRSVEQALAARIGDLFEGWRAAEEKTLHESFEALTARFAREAEGIVEQIQQAAAEQFGFAWRAAPLPERLHAESGFSLAVEELTGWGLGRFPLLLPGFLFQRYLRSRLRMLGSAELGRHAGRLRTDLGDRLEKSTREFLAALNRYVQDGRAAVFDALHRAATMKQSSEQVQAQARAAQARRRNLLAAFEGDLDSILSGNEVG
jgi:GTPase SAR1 family protein